MSDGWIRKLLAGLSLSDHTQSQYATCLRYWDAWHRLRYEGKPLPLAEEPPAEITPCVWRDFKADHSAVVASGLLQAGMDADIWNKLQQLGFNRKQPSVSSLSACWKMMVLSSLQGKLGFTANFAELKEFREQIRASWMGARAVVGAVDTTPLAATSLVEQLRHACPDTRDGVRAAALVTLLQHLSARQVVNLQFGDLEPIDLVRDHNVTRVIDLKIRQPRDNFQRSEPIRRLRGNDAAAVYMWGDVRFLDVMGAHCDLKRPPADTAFFVRENFRGNGSLPVSEYWISKTMRQLARWSGIYRFHEPSKYSPRAIRSGYALQTREQQTLVKIARRANLGQTRSVMRILRNHHF